MNILDYLKYIIDKKHNTHNFIEVFWGFFFFYWKKAASKGRAR